MDIDAAIDELRSEVHGEAARLRQQVADWNRGEAAKQYLRLLGTIHRAQESAGRLPRANPSVGAFSAQLRALDGELAAIAKDLPRASRDAQLSLIDEGKMQEVYAAIADRALQSSLPDRGKHAA